MPARTSPLTPRRNVIPDLLTPDNCVLLLIDHQPLSAFGIQSADVSVIRNNVTGLAKAAKAFDLPTVLTTVAAKDLAGSIFPEIQDVFPDQEPIDRSSLNAWDNQEVVQAVEATGRSKIVMAGLTSDVCLAMPVISALKDGYEVYIVTDASGGQSYETHQRAVERMVQAGAVPTTWEAVLFELQRDLASEQTLSSVMEIAKQHSGAFGLALHYVEELLSGTVGGGYGGGSVSGRVGTRKG